ncbi:MAG TPA: hypothetical protein EYP90_02670 [Chromatiaceae bacterium]|nr:hypothetical protein [Chromatiaceae bacterium]
MVILVNDVDRGVSAGELKALVEQYHPIEKIDAFTEHHDHRDWRVDIGETDREVANFVTDRLNGYYWRGSLLNAYCPLYQ